MGSRVTWAWLKIFCHGLMILAWGRAQSDAGEVGNFPPFWNQSDDFRMQRSVLSRADPRLSEVIGIVLNKSETFQQFHYYIIINIRNLTYFLGTLLNFTAQIDITTPDSTLTRTTEVWIPCKISHNPIPSRLVRKQRRGYCVAHTWSIHWHPTGCVHSYKYLCLISLFLFQA